MLRCVEKQKLQRLIRQSLRSLCEAGLPDSTNITIQGLVAVTVNSNHVILVGLHEEIGDGGEVEMIHESLKDSPSHAGITTGKGTYMSSDMQAKMLQQTHAAMLHEHMMQVMQAGMVATQGMQPATPDKSGLRQFSKQSPPEHEKSSFSYSAFNDSDDEDLPASTTQAFALTSSPRKAISTTESEDGKEPFSFTNYNQSLFSRTKGQPVEAESATSSESAAKEGDKTLTPSEQVQQASTITITPVVESPKPDDQTAPKPQSILTQIVPVATVPEFGRKLGTLMAVKQEGAGRRRRGSSKSQQLPEEAVRVDEVSDGDNSNMQTDNRVQDPMVGGNNRTTLIPAGTHIINADDSPPPISHTTTAIGPVIIHNIVDEHHIPVDAIMEIDSLDSEDQRHDFVDLDNSLLQILPDMGSERIHVDGSIHEVVEIDDSDDVKGEPREGGGGGGVEGEAASSSDRLQVLMELQKKIAAEINTENKISPDADTTGATAAASTSQPQQDNSDMTEDIEEYFIPPPIPPFIGGRGGVKGWAGLKGRHGGGFGRFFHRGGGFGGRGAMCGRGGLFGRGAHMMGFGHHHGHHGHHHYGDKTHWRCKLCAVPFNSKTAYESHMLKHENKGQCDAGLDESVGMSCPYCKKRFRYKSWLEQHITSHTKEKLFHCPYCSKAYTRRRNVRKHIQMFHPEVLMGQVIDTAMTNVTVTDDVTVKQQDEDSNDT